MLRHAVHLRLQFARIFDHPFGRQSLGGEAHVHHGRRVSLGRCQVDQPALSQQVDAPAVRQRELVHVLAHAFAFADGHLPQPVDVDFHVEMAGIGQDRAVFHLHHVLGPDDVVVAGERAEQVPFLGGFDHRHHAVAVHCRLQGADRVDLRDDHVGAHPLGTHGEALATPAVPRYNDLLSGQQNVRGADDAVDGGLPRAVTVIEQILGFRVVHGDHRELEGAVPLHRAQANDAGGGLFHAAQNLLGHLRVVRVDVRNQVSAVVHRYDRAVLDAAFDVRVVRVAVFALDGEHRDVVVLGERRRNVVLGGQRVAGAQNDVGAASLERSHQVGRFGRNVQACRHLLPGQRFFLAEPLADLRQNRHVPIRPLDSPFPLVSQTKVLHVEFHRLLRSRFVFPASVLGCTTAPS